MKRLSTLLFLLAFLLIGCSGKDKIKPSADSLLTTEAFEIIDHVKSAYEEKNKNDLNKYLGAHLAENIIEGLYFESAELSLTPRMVRITESSLKVNINWQGAWVLANGGKLENRGVADLVFHRETMKLSFIDGDNPFTIPSIR